MAPNDMVIQELLTTQRSMAADIVAIKEILAEKRGERRVALWAAGAAGSAGSLLMLLAKTYFGVLLGKHS